MTTNHDSIKNNHDNKEFVLNDELNERFDTLLQNTSSELDMFSKPDKMTSEIKRIPFGKYLEDTITLSRTDELDGSTWGILSYNSANDTDESFFIRANPKRGTDWYNEGYGKLYTSASVAKVLDRNWPINDDFKPSDRMPESLKTNLNKDSTPAKDILVLVENYALRNNLGDQEYESSWSYRDMVGGVNSEVGTYTISGKPNDDFRAVSAEINMPYMIKNSNVDLRCRVSSNEIGRVTLVADYQDPETNRRTRLPISNPEAIFNEFEYMSRRIVDAKRTF